MGKCKTKAIHAELGIFTHISANSEILRHNHANSAIIQACSEPCITLNPGIFKILLYSEHWYIQNLGIFRIRSIFRTLSNIYDGTFCKKS